MSPSRLPCSARRRTFCTTLGLSPFPVDSRSFRSAWLRRAARPNSRRSRSLLSMRSRNRRIRVTTRSTTRWFRLSLCRISDCLAFRWAISCSIFPFTRSPGRGPALSSRRRASSIFVCSLRSDRITGWASSRSSFSLCSEISSNSFRDSEVPDAKPPLLQPLAQEQHLADGRDGPAHGVGHLFVALLDALGDPDLSLAGEQRRPPHLAEIHANRIVRPSHGGRREVQLGLGRGLLLRRLLPIGPLAPIGGVHHLDVHLSQGPEDLIEPLGRGLLLGKLAHDLIVGEVTLLLSQEDERLDLFDSRRGRHRLGLWHRLRPRLRRLPLRGRRRHDLPRRLRLRVGFLRFGDFRLGFLSLDLPRFRWSWLRRRLRARRRGPRGLWRLGGDLCRWLLALLRGADSLLAASRRRRPRRGRDLLPCL